MNKQVSEDRDRPVEYAMDGALHYARFLAAKHTVVGIAVSGTPTSNRWTAFLMPKGSIDDRPLVSPTGAAINGLVPMGDLIRTASFDPAVQSQRVNDLIAFSQDMHVFMRDEAKLEEKEKPLAVAGSLIALRNSIFAKTYDAYPARDLPSFWMETIVKEVKKARLPIDKSA